MSISWGKSRRISFAGAWKLGDWSAPEIPAVYAITYKQDPSARPKFHTVLFFGESNNLAELGLPWNHERSGSWIENAGSKEHLFIFVHPLPGATQSERWRLHEQLVSEYRPVCNAL